MATPEQLDELAQRYLDLFEAEDSAAVADPALGEALDRFTRSWIAAAQASWGLAPRVWNAAGSSATASQPAVKSAGEGTPDDARAAHGATPTAAASGSGPGDLATLRARLEELERQLAELEPATERRREPDEGTGGRRA